MLFKLALISTSLVIALLITARAASLPGGTTGKSRGRRIERTHEPL